MIYQKTKVKIFMSKLVKILKFLLHTMYIIFKKEIEIEFDGEWREEQGRERKRGQENWKRQKGRLLSYCEVLIPPFNSFRLHCPTKSTKGSSLGIWLPAF